MNWLLAALLVTLGIFLGQTLTLWLNRHDVKNAYTQGYYVGRETSWDIDHDED